MNETSHGVWSQRLARLRRSVLTASVASAVALAATSSTRCVQAAEPAADRNNMGININNAGNENAPLFADMMKTVGSPTVLANDTLAPVDANGWPTSDFRWYLVDGNFVKDLSGTYRIRFKGQATIDFQFGGMAVSGQTYDAATNTTTATITCTQTITLILRMTNTRRTASSALNTGVTDIQLMRPKAVGSTTPYAFTDTFTDQSKTIAGKFNVLRFMDYKATNSNGDVSWSTRVRPLAAGRNAPAGYGWQGLGSAWEYAVQMANETNGDMWICIPYNADADYITKVAQLIRFGSDGTNPYTTTQANPVFAPLNSGLKVYVEYSNEIWNFFGGFRQSSDNQTAADNEVAAGNTPLNYDGSTNKYDWARRRVGNQIVKISKTFRNVWGDSNMMTRVRPLLEWQYGDANGTGSVPLQFIDNYYNNADGNHVSDPRPVNYYLWGGGSAAYYNPADNDSDTLTVDQILNESDLTKRPSQWDDKKIDIGWTTTFGLKRTAYEGGLGLGDNPLAHSPDAKKAAVKDIRLKDVVKNNQNFWSQYGGDLLVYFQNGADVGYGFTDENFSTTTPKLQAIDDLRLSTKATPTLGILVPATIPAANFTNNSRWNLSPAGSGGIANFGFTGDNATAVSSWSSYMIRVPSTGTYSVKVNYSSSVASSLKVWAAGNLIGTATINNNGGSAADSATFSTTLNAGLSSVRIQAPFNTPNYTINSITVSSGGSSTPTPTPTPAPSGDGSAYGGTARSLPGTVQAEDFNTGGQGVAYNDSDAQNSGTQYRTGDGVDIETAGDTGGGYDVGWTSNGEWLKYAVNVASTGTYSLTVRVASIGGGTMRVEVGGVDKTGSIAVPNTGGWQTWQSVTVNNVSLSAGAQTMRVVFTSSNVNLNWIQVAGTASSPVKLTGTVIGTTGSWDGVSTRDKAFDGDLSTFFDATASQAWTGLNLGSSKTLSQVKYAPRNATGWGPTRMVGGKFQGSTTADFSSGVTDLFTIGAAPPIGSLTTQNVSGSYRYVRYLGPLDSYGNVSEIEFWGN